ncbi:MAG TPA: BamA/TamA family outer membrane protein, partial [Coleofasciculaceae cyanobacterium]
LFGALSIQEQNLGGNNQTLSAEVQAGLRSLQFDTSFSDPWIAGDPYHTSYSVNAFGRQSISLVFDGGPDEVNLPNGDRPRVYRLGGGTTFSRPLGNGWTASLGVQYQNVSIRDSDGNISPEDEFGNLLSFHSSGIDNILSIQASAALDRRNSTLQTTSGSLLRISDEQTIPIDGITFNRIRGSYSYFIPVKFTQISPECRKKDRAPTDCPETLAFNVQGGTILGDLPPYEAFSLGGTDSVRGYQSGDLGSGRSFLTATAEYRFPIFSILGGALFFDAGTDLGTASEVPGDPAGIRGKPGSGFGYGVGLRIRSPIGQIRVDYAINDQGGNEFHFGIGERF